jgi:hypothetical protein
MWTVVTLLLRCSTLFHHPLDQDQARHRALHQGQHPLEVAVGVGQHVKLRQIVMVMLTVGLAKSSVPDLVPVCGARRHLSEGWAFFIYFNAFDPTCSVF